MCIRRLFRKPREVARIVIINYPDRTVTLPSEEEIMARLQELDLGENDYMAEEFYPTIGKEAGRELNAWDIVEMFAEKIHNFVSSRRSPMIIGILHTHVPQFIDALVDDEEIARLAKNIHKELMSLSPIPGFKTQ